MTNECNSCQNAGSCGIERMVQALEKIPSWDNGGACTDMARAALNARSQVCEGYQQTKESDDDS